MSEAQARSIVIVGGGTGGCAAALGATAMGLSVIMTEETDWIGGQLTSQAVPPDENSDIETYGGTGYTGLYPRPDITGAEYGLAKSP